MSAATGATGGRPKSVLDGGRSAAIDGIRGLAALALLTVHVGMFSGLLGTRALGTPRPPSNFVGAFFVSGLPSFIGVFFVMPALFLYLPTARAVIAGVERPKQGRGLFRRLLRLLPGYYVMYLVVLVALNRNAIDSVWFVLRPIFLLQVYLPSPFVPKMMNGMEISWTVPSMVQWYLLLPLIARLISGYASRGTTARQRARRLLVPVPVLISLGFGWLFFVKANGWDNRIVFWWPLGFATCIGIGMMLAVLAALAQVSPADTPKIFRLVRTHPYWFWLGAVAVYLVNCARPFSVIGMDAIYSVAGLLMTYIMVALFGLLASLPLITPGTDSGPVTAFLGSRPVKFLGQVSYGVYLWHFAVMHFLMQPSAVVAGNAKPIRELYASMSFIPLETGTFLGALALATASYYLVEKPCVALGERYLKSRGGEGASSGRRSAVAALLPRPVAVVAEPGAVLTVEEAVEAARVLAAERDAVQANLLDLDGSYGKQLLAGAVLTGRSSARWEATTADLTAMWELFNGYASVVERVEAMVAQPQSQRRPSAGELAALSALLTGPAVHVVRGPAPLARRQITDDGTVRLSLAAAVREMNELFARSAETVTAAETIWSEVTRRIDAVVADADRVGAAARERGDRAVLNVLAGFEAELVQLRALLAEDPFAWWERGSVRTGELDRLARRISAVDRADRTESRNEVIEVVAVE